MRARRADAVRNQERIVVAARELFSKRGLDVPVEEIALRAGVGKATVYRSFPTKDHLVATIAIIRLDWLTGLAEAACEKPDAWEAFGGVIHAVADAQAADCSLADTLAAAITLEATQAPRNAMRAALGRLMRKAQEQGRMTADADVDDVRIFFMGTAHALDRRDRDDAAIWRRHADRFLRSLAA